jgi:hypothetical protein
MIKLILDHDVMRIGICCLLQFPVLAMFNRKVGFILNRYIDKQVQYVVQKGTISVYILMACIFLISQVATKRHITLNEIQLPYHHDHDGPFKE